MSVDSIGPQPPIDVYLKHVEGRRGQGRDVGANPSCDVISHLASLALSAHKGFNVWSLLPLLLQLHHKTSTLTK
jgi:hypothetical protein